MPSIRAERESDWFPPWSPPHGLHRGLKGAKPSWREGQINRCTEIPANHGGLHSWVFWINFSSPL